MAAAWAASTSAASAVAAQRGSRGRGRRRRRRRRRGRSQRRRPPLAAHAAAEPGSRRAASWPAIAPISAPPKAIVRSRWTTGRASTSRRGIGASSRWRTSAASRRSARRRCRCADRGRPRRRRRGAEHGRATVEDVGDLARRRRLVGDELAQPEHDAAADEGGEVHAVGDLEPLHEPAGPPGAPHLAQHHRRGRHRLATLTGHFAAAELARWDLRRASAHPAGVRRLPVVILGGDVGAGDAGVRRYLRNLGTRRARRRPPPGPSTRGGSTRSSAPSSNPERRRPRRTVRRHGGNVAWRTPPSFSADIAASDDVRRRLRRRCVQEAPPEGHRQARGGNARWSPDGGGVRRCFREVLTYLGKRVAPPPLRRWKSP